MQILVYETFTRPLSDLAASTQPPSVVPPAAAGIPTDYLTDMTTWHDLPHELVAIIISMLHNDIDASRTCALVCRSWVALSQRNIFYAIYLDLHNGDCERLLLLLEHALDIASYVRLIYLVAERTDLEWETLPACRQLLPRLSSLNGLTLVLRTSPLSVLAMLPSLSSITRLELYCSFPSTLHFRQFVGAFRNLSELILRRLSLSWDDPLGDIPHIDTPPLRLIWLRCQNVNAVASMVLRWLLEQPSPVHLQELSIVLDPEGQVIFRDFLRMSGPSLKTLDICGCELQCLTVGRWPSQPTSFTDIEDGVLDLKDCISLTKLELRSCSLHLLTGTLATVRSAHMRSICLWFGGDGAAFEWDVLRAMLEQERFLQLNKVTIRCVLAWNNVHLPCLASLQERGILCWK